MPPEKVQDTEECRFQINQHLEMTRVPQHPTLDLEQLISKLYLAAADVDLVLAPLAA